MFLLLTRRIVGLFGDLFVFWGVHFVDLGLLDRYCVIWLWLGNDGVWLLCCAVAFVVFVISLDCWCVVGFWFVVCVLFA